MPTQHQTAFNTGIISERLFSRLDLRKYAGALADSRNMQVLIEGGIEKRRGTYFVAETEGSDTGIPPRLIKFEYRRDDNLVIEMRGNQFRFLNKDGYMQDEFDNDIEVNHPYTWEQLRGVRFYQDNDVIYFTHYLHPIMKLSRVSNTNWILEVVDFQADQVAPTRITGVSNDAGTVTDEYQVTAFSSDDGESLVGNVPVILELSDFVRAVDTGTGDKIVTIRKNDKTTAIIENDVDTVILVPIRYRVSTVFLYRWYLSSKPWVDTGNGTYTSEVAGGVTISFRLATIGEINEHLPDTLSNFEYNIGRTTLTIPNSKETVWDNTISWNEAKGAENYKIYKKSRQSDIFGFIGEVNADNLSFTDAHIEADFEESPPEIENPFEGDTNYPQSVSEYQQRLILASTLSDPKTIWLSQTGNYENLSRSSPLRDTDSIEMRLSSGRGYDTRHAIKFNERVFLMTSGNILSLSGAGDNLTITPKRFTIREETEVPCSELEPIVIRNQLLFISASTDYGYELNALQYDVQHNNYVASDLTILVKDLFENFKIFDWDYAHYPRRLLACVRDNGDMAVMSYFAQEQVYAWNIWETDGKFHSIVSLPSDNFDDFYMVVERNDFFYIERLTNELNSDINERNYLDSAVEKVVSGGKIQGLEHLESQEVIVMINGGKEYTLPVTGGEITVSDDFNDEKAIVGLPYEASITTVPLNFDVGTLSRKKTVNRIGCRIYESRGVFAKVFNKGQERESVKLRSRMREDWGTAPAPLTDFVDLPVRSAWGKDFQLVIGGEAGLPFTLLSAHPYTNSARLDNQRVS